MARAEARTKAEEAKRRCIDAGLDWEALPRPPRGPRELADRGPDGAKRSIDDELSAAAEKHGREGAGQHPPSEAAGVGGGAIGGLAAYRWLALGQAEPAHETADGAAWFEGSDGSLWYRDPGGGLFAWDGANFAALGSDGSLHGLAAGAAAPDGSDLTGADPEPGDAGGGPDGGDGGELFDGLFG